MPGIVASSSLGPTPLASRPSVGRERPRLQLHERGRHDEELARGVDVHPVVVPQGRDRGQELIRDLHDRNVVDVHFRPPDQVEQQVERPLEGAEPDRVFVLDRHESTVPPRSGERGPTGGAIPRPARTISSMSTKPSPTTPRTVDAAAEIEFVAEALRAERDAIERIAANAAGSSGRLGRRHRSGRRRARVTWSWRAWASRA